MSGWIRRGWVSHFWGTSIFSPKVPKTLVLTGSGTSGRKIGAPQKGQIQPQRIHPPILGPLMKTDALHKIVRQNYLYEYAMTFFDGKLSWWTFRPRKKKNSPPPQIPRRHPPGPSHPPLFGRTPPPFLGFSIENRPPPPPCCPGLPLPLPRPKKK